MQREIVIAGAGVAGLTAAIGLRRAGRAVRVVEPRTASGAHRAGWDAVENWTTAEDLPGFLDRAGIDRGAFQHVSRCALSVVDPYGRRYDLQSPRPLFYLVKRGAAEGGLERGLQRQAEAMGARLEYGAACRPGQADIWAAGTCNPRAQFISLALTFETQHPDWVCGLVDMTVAPRAYAYLAIVAGQATLAVVLTEAWRDSQRLLDRAVAAFQRHAQLEIDPARADLRRAGGSGGDLDAFWRERREMVVGEAGGFQDFLWGFGARHALTSGFLAAQALLTGQDWQALADRELRPLVRASLVNRWLYDRMPKPGYALLVRQFARSCDLNALVGHWCSPHLLHRVLWPIVARHYRRERGAGAAPRL